MREKSRYKLSGPDCAAYVLVFVGSIIICQFDTLTLSHQTQFTLRQTVSLLDIQKIFLAGLPCWGPEKKHFFYRTRPRSRETSLILRGRGNGWSENYCIQVRKSFVIYVIHKICRLLQLSVQVIVRY